MRPDGLACREIEIAAGACGVRQGERAGTDLAPAEMMEGSYSSSCKWRGIRVVEKEAMNLI